MESVDKRPLDAVLEVFIAKTTENCWRLSEMDTERQQRGNQKHQPPETNDDQHSSPHTSLRLIGHNNVVQILPIAGLSSMRQHKQSDCSLTHNVQVLNGEMNSNMFIRPMWGGRT